MPSWWRLVPACSVWGWCTWAISSTCCGSRARRRACLNAATACCCSASTRPRGDWIAISRRGGAPDQPSEAEVARAGLFARGLAVDTPLWLEAQSRDTLQNLRNARDLLDAGLHVDGARQRVTLLSSRYHLARCALFARQLGFDARLCAAETTLELGPRMLMRIAGEAAYVCLTDIGARWARLIGHKRMLERLS